MDTKLNILADQPIGTIAPRLYGHFAEHLGRCCYDGLWGANAAGVNSFRQNVITALKALPVPMLRWPGGCYADHYHWRDGIGPTDRRVRRLGMSCGLQVEDDNSLDTHEFIDLCQRIGAEPYLAGNVGSGTPQELCDWVEYCNAAIDTTLVRERRVNGADQPFGVKVWGVGNENWGCGGNFDASSYAREYRRFATMLRHVDPQIELVISGSGDALATSDTLDTWNVEMLQTLRPHLGLVDHLSVHRYWINGGPETAFSADEYYGLLNEAQLTEDLIVRTAALLQEESPHRKIGIALDEWGVWHPEAREWGPGQVARRSPVTYEQANTLRDALAVGVALETFHRHCDVLSMANLAQIVNVLQSVVMTAGQQMWLTPTYYALQLHTPHLGATALPVAIEGGNILPDGSSAVTATASRGSQGTAVTLINRHYTQETVVRFEALGMQGQAQLLSADQANAVNSLAQPDRVRTAALAVAREGSHGWCLELPPHSLATVVIA
jgi:alpha-N-arabinofuranosidase